MVEGEDKDIYRYKSLPGRQADPRCIPYELSICTWSKISAYPTDSILCFGVTTSDGSPFERPKRNSGLAIKTMPTKLHTNVMLITTAAR